MAFWILAAFITDVLNPGSADRFQEVLELGLGGGGITILFH